MSDTGEQGLAQADRTRGGDVGGGIVPDDKTEGEVEQSLLQPGHGQDADAAPAGSSTGGPTGPAAEAPKTSG